jgi:competence protein ComFA
LRFSIVNQRLLPEVLGSKGITEWQPISSFSSLPSIPINSTFSYFSELQQFLVGRALLLDELPFSIEQIHCHYEHGYVTYMKGIIKRNNKWVCGRCGNDDPFYIASFPCARCQEICTYCRRCIQMRRVSTCTPLVRWTGPDVTFQIDRDVLVWDGHLSPGQQMASDAVVEAVRTNSDLLVWAVCGAGKTEVVFQGISEALRQNKRVCIAIPRRDVVQELTPRMQRVFPNVKVVSLYGGSEERHTFSPLVVATTHQLYRFYEAFDCMIVDEVDAFPYSYDKTLQWAVQKARKPKSSLILLTATPTAQWQKECKTGKRRHVMIPARFHRHPLPVPQLQWCGNWKKQMAKGCIPSPIVHWVNERLHQQKQAFLFFPDIDLMKQALPLFRRLDPNIEAVHADDPDRSEKVERMRKGEIPILLTTTILERGVTIPNLDVAVIGADHSIFTESALVQMAGRVGRSPQYPTGNVNFFHYGLTNEMVRAVRHIQRMNTEARKRGLIDG